MSRPFKLMVVLVFAITLGIVAQGERVSVAAAEAKVCSCASCPNPYDGAQSIVVGTALGWERVRDASGRLVVHEGVGDFRYAPIVVHVRVTESYRASVGPDIWLPDRLNQDNNGDFVWDAPGSPNCGGFHGIDPTGRVVAVALGLRISPDDEAYWQSLGIEGTSGELDHIRVEVSQRGLSPLPPAAGGGLASSASQDSNWILTALLLMSIACRNRLAKMDRER